MRFTLGLTGLYHYFEGRIFSAIEVQHGKPAPDLFLYAASKMNVDPANCAVIEDSPHGIIAALSAGMRVYGYCGGLSSCNTLKEAGAITFKDMAELPGLLPSYFSNSLIAPE